MVPLEVQDAVDKALSVMSDPTVGLARVPAVTAESSTLYATFLWDSLQPTPEEIAEACRRIVLRADPFWPSIGQFADEIRKLRGVDSGDVAQERAWQLARRLMRDVGPYGSVTLEDVGGDGAVLWAIEQYGWERLGETTGETRAICRKEFVRLYELALADGLSTSKVLGISERENLARGVDPSNAPALRGRGAAGRRLPVLPEVPASSGPVDKKAIKGRLEKLTQKMLGQHEDYDL